MAPLYLIIVVAIIATVFAPSATISQVSSPLAVLDDDDADDRNEDLLGVGDSHNPDAPTSTYPLVPEAILVLTGMARTSRDPATGDSPPRLLASDHSAGDIGQDTGIDSSSVISLPLRC